MQSGNRYGDPGTLKSGAAYIESPRSASRGTPLIAAFREHASRYPGRPAISAGRELVTYGELDRRSDAVARQIREHPVGDPVAIMASRGFALVTAVLATWKAGAAFLALDPDDPPAWSRHLATRAGVSLCLSCSPPDRLPGTAWIDLSQEAEESGAALPPVPAPDDLAYLAVTSGSTGEPRLVMLEHRGVENLAAIQREAWGVPPADARILSYSRPSFDGVVFESVLALANGVRLEVIDEAAVAGQALEDFLATRRITHAILPAAVLRTLPGGHLPDLDILVSCGDVCLPETARRWAATCKFFNGYGPTEATVCSTLHRVTPADLDRPTVSIGRPVTGVRVVISDAGEICVGGAGTARGYFGDQVQTAERFVPDPDVRGEVLFRTGDRGLIGASGDIEFLGRLDDEIKVRGVRIQPLGVEQALRDLPEVREAAVVARKSGDEWMLTAYVVPEQEAASGTAIRTAAARAMPAAWVPDTVVVADALPLTANGKVDRAQLRQASGVAADSAAGAGAQTERALAAIAADLLGVSHIDVHEHLLDLGGHSLLVAQFVARARTVLGHQLELKTVVTEGTIAKIAADLDRRLAAHA